MFELALLLLLLLVLVWIYTIDRKKAEPPVFNINVNIDGLDNVKTENRQQTTSVNESLSTPAKKTKKVIPIEEPKKNSAVDWKDITPTDSNL